MKPFTRPTLNIEQLKRGYAELDYKVEGFDNSPITVRIDEGYSFSERKRYPRISISAYSTNSSIQRGNESRNHSFDEHQNFALALIDATEYAKELEAQAEVFMLLFEQEDELRKIKRQQELDDDPALGEDYAKKKVTEFQQGVKSGTWAFLKFKIRRRASQDWDECYVECNGRVKWMRNHYTVSKKRMIADIAQAAELQLTETVLA